MITLFSILVAVALIGFVALIIWLIARASKSEMGSTYDASTDLYVPPTYAPSAWPSRTSSSPSSSSSSSSYSSYSSSDSSSSSYSSSDSGSSSSSDSGFGGGDSGGGGASSDW